MISNYIKNGLWLWITLCLTLGIIFKQPELRPHTAQMVDLVTLGLWGGGAIFLVALIIARYIDYSRSARRLTELYRRVQSGETVEIRGASGVIRLIVMLAVTGVVVAALLPYKEVPFHGLQLSLLMGGVGILALHELLTVIPLLRQPILRISRETLESPLFGTLSWRDVDKFDLKEVRLRVTLQYRLEFLIPQLPGLTQQLHPATRLQDRIRSLFRPNDQLHLRLIRATELPKVILMLCRRTKAAYTSEPQYVEAGLTAANPEAVALLESMRQVRKDMLKQQDQAWEWWVKPPPGRTHWTTWVATGLAAVFVVWFVYMLYSSTF